MRLIIGGQGQGKLSYALKYGYTKEDVSFCGECETEKIFDKKIVYNFHDAIRRLMEKNINPLSFIEANIQDDVIIICNEVGSGIVPVCSFERRYRNMVGTVCCELAERADTVERICCGIPNKIKG